MKRTHTGEACEELQPMGRTHIGEVYEGLSLMAGTPTGAGDECEEEVAETRHDELIAISIFCPPAPLARRQRKIGVKLSLRKKKQYRGGV